MSSSLIDGYLQGQTAPAKQPVKNTYLKAGLFDSSSSSDSDFYERKMQPKKDVVKSGGEESELEESELKDFE